MEIHQPVFDSAARAFDIENDELGRFVAAAASDLEAIGNFWGDGPEGVTFAKGGGGGSGYEAVTGQVMAGVAGLLEAHEKIAGGLRLMAGNVQLTEWALVAAMLSTLPPADPDQPIWGENWPGGAMFT